MCVLGRDQPADRGFCAIYKRMRAASVKAVARRHRSQGQEERKIRAAADYEVTKTSGGSAERPWAYRCVVKG